MRTVFVLLTFSVQIIVCGADVDDPLTPEPDGPKLTTLSAPPEHLCGGVNCHNDVVQQTCVDGKCRCKEGYKGCPGLCCYDEATEDCGVVLNDPTVKTFDQERVDLPFPCRYLVTSNKLIAQPINCFFTIHAFNGKDKGRFFVTGFDLAIQEIIIGARNQFATFRVIGIAYDGTYTYNEYSKNNVYDTDGTMAHEHVPGFTMRYDEDMNAVTFHSEICGLKIKFRAYDMAYGINQRFVPGLCVSVRKHNLMDWNNNKNPMFLPPGIKLANIKVGSASDEQSFFLRAMNHRVSQRFPGGSPLCKNLVQSECTTVEKKEEFLKKCYWIMKGHKFVGRNDQSYDGHHILNLILRCFRAVCKNQQCLGFQNSLNSAKYPATPVIEELQKWRNGEFCNRP